MLGLMTVAAFAVAATAWEGEDWQSHNDWQQHSRPLIPHVHNTRFWSSGPHPSSSSSSSSPSLSGTTATATTEPSVTSRQAVPSTSTEVVWATIDITTTVCTAEACQAAPTSATPIIPGSGAGHGDFNGPGPDWNFGPGHGPGNLPPGCAFPSSPLSSDKQAGQSLWGSLCQPTFPKWLPDGEGKQYASAPWGDRTTRNADGVKNDHIPVTGVVRRYDFTITRGTAAPDGVVRNVFLVNNQFPGPAIEANWGDMIEITVHNNISYPLEGTSLHWHGFLQRGSNWMDGVPAVSQCPIAPFHSYTYKIPAQLYGSSWWHAHYSAQYTAGIVGPIIIYGPSQLSYDIDIGPVMLSDWYHVPYFSIVSDAVGTDMSVIPPVSDSLLINGRGRFDCSTPSYDNGAEWLASHVSVPMTWSCTEGAELAKFKFRPGKTHRLRLMNMGADGVQKFSIDGHQMTVISYDYVPTVPHISDVVTLGVGQRADILVTANNFSTNMFWMRSSAPGGKTCGGSNMDEVRAAIYYEGADTAGIPATVSAVNDTSCENLPLNTTQPEYRITPSAPQDAFVHDISISLVLNSTGNYEWRMANQTFHANFNEPLLYKAAEGNVSFPYDPQWNVVNYGTNRSIVVNVTNLTPFAHPFHLHGHNFYVLNVGNNGTVWDGTAVNPSNPMRRDIQIIPALGYAAIAFENDNPGVWPFHCHVAWHLSGGLAMNFITRPEDIPKIPSEEAQQTCRDWDFYSSNNIVDQIDAGS
ncbi:oxidoreductase ptaK [Fulvia fulva]|uniref:Oxidoreductase ptaK n=1 Tax=Passalora fulva TaxID=5499 RepID=A0A9Q8L8G4_PASFU|nr:oxidoreductase ptaK [Fulvia fulva]KAK4636170.1 oxidoreductase ptaK [Fulvia fulva]KAK4636542.1 oxidoreductase ptaK [Fulvia fulva]UJO12654.1 oxidoreductase ptaK [Fulvia fulva]WPV09409.1 oxidoreductase ptaK [Fulvia fulva]WPV23810.1 oxidoreductase ptaK [Fulvia fulva]